MSQEAVLSRGFLNGAKATGIIMAICGSIDAIVGVRFLVLVLSNLNSSQLISVDGFWSGIPLLITGLWLVSSTRKRTKQAISTCVIPCLITFITSLLQAISSGVLASTYARIYGAILDMRDCPDDSVCEFIQIKYGCILGLVIASSIGAGLCFLNVIVGGFYLKSATEDAIPAVINGVVLAQPSTQVVISSQTTTSPMQPAVNYGPPMQPPLNYGPPGYSVQPNNPQVATTRDDAMLMP